MFSPLITDRWLPDGARALGPGESFAVVDASLDAEARGSLLHVNEGPTIVTLSPELAESLGLADRTRVDDTTAARLSGTGDDSDHAFIFYLTAAARAALEAETRHEQSRRLTTADQAAFDEFIAQAPAADVEEAYVELDHWLVFGTFIDGRLVSAASAYPWDGTRLADIGVITDPDFRGQGLGGATVRAISAAALERGHEPQYRCQYDNAPSTALARATGFTRFAEYEAIGA